jgi:hypothetical protein
MEDSIERLVLNMKNDEIFNREVELEPFIDR